MPRVSCLVACARSRQAGPTPGCRNRCPEPMQRTAAVAVTWLLRPRHGHLCVLLGRHAGHADGTDNLAIDNDWHPTFQRQHVAHRKQNADRRHHRRQRLASPCSAAESLARCVPCRLRSPPSQSAYGELLQRDERPSRVQDQGRSKCGLCAFAAKIPPPPAPVTLVRHDFSATRSASNRGSLRSCRPRSTLCRKDRANHQSNSQSTRRYPSRSPDILPRTLAHPWGYVIGGSAHPGQMTQPNVDAPACSFKEF